MYLVVCRCIEYIHIKDSLRTRDIRHNNNNNNNNNSILMINSHLGTVSKVHSFLETHFFWFTTKPTDLNNSACLN